MKAKDPHIIERMHSVAREFVLHRSLTEWDMATFARECGLTKRTLYTMIESKEGLIQSAVLGVIADVQARLAQIIEGEGEFLVALKRLLVEFPTILASLHARRFGAVFRQYPGIEKRVIEERETLTAKVRSFFDRGIADGRLREDLDSALLVATLQAVVLHFLKLDLPAGEFQQQLEQVFTYLLDGIVRDETE